MLPDICKNTEYFFLLWVCKSWGLGKHIQRLFNFVGKGLNVSFESRMYSTDAIRRPFMNSSRARMKR